jgi:CO dehydrogenase maturation factor
MARELEVNVRNTFLVVNRLNGEPPQELQSAIEALGIEVAARVPADEKIGQFDSLGKPLVDLPPDSAAGRAIEALTEHVLSLL